MSTPTKPTASVIRPGKAPEGPPGWEERRIEKQIEAQEAQEKRNHRRENSTGIAGMKEKIHNLGEKMHLVEPRDPAQRTAAQLQVRTPLWLMLRYEVSRKERQTDSGNTRLSFLHGQQDASTMPETAPIQQ